MATGIEQIWVGFQEHVNMRWRPHQL